MISYNISNNLKLYKSILCIILIFLLKSYNSDIYAEEFFISSGSKFKVAIFKEEGFPSICTPDLLTPEWLYSSLLPYFSVTYLDSAQLSDRKYLNNNNFDLLILPYGETFPYTAFASIKEYLFKGGGLFNIAGRPFWVPMEKNGHRWQKKEGIEPYREFLSPLGIKYYELPNNGYIGLSVTTSLGAFRIAPTHGNVFPYRIPVRDFTSLEFIEGKKNTWSVILTKGWRNPYVKDLKAIPQKWCLVGAREENHPLDPRNFFAQETLIKIIEYLSFPIIIYELETDLATYYPKEKVNISLKVMNYGKNKEKSIIELRFLDKAEKIAYKKIRSINLGAGEGVILNETWQPEEFKSDFYKVTALLKKGERILDKEENGFVVINEDILKNGPSIQIKGNGFIIKGKEGFLFGTNYYESKLGELMWLRPNILKIRKDFKSMRTLGINFVRIHYHHSKWFRDYFLQVIKEESIGPYFRVADTTALPSERSLRILDAIIQLAQEQGLIFCMDIFSLVPEEMGNPVGWLGLKERLLDKDKVRFQKKFVELLANRYEDVPGITWDLWNEPRLEKDDLELLRKWSRQMKDIFRENGDNHLITIGDNLSPHLLDVLDYASLHTYEPSEFGYLKDLDKPFIFQEVWNDAGCSINDEIKQAEELKKDFSDFLKTQAAGFVPWQWTKQARLWNNTSESEKWDDDLGVCVYEDGTLKLAGDAYKSLISQTKE